MNRRVLVPMIAVAALAGVADAAEAGGPARQPDGQIKLAEETAFTGVDVYLFASDIGGGYGSASPQQRFISVLPPDPQVFNYRVENDGAVSDRFRLIGGRGTSDLQVKYFKGTQNVSADVKAGRYKTKLLAPGERQWLRIEVTPDGFIPGTFRFPVTSTSTKDGSAVDVVRFGHELF